MTTTALQLKEATLPIGSLEAYIAYVNSMSLLSAEEEFDLATQLRETGDLEAARKLVMAHLRFVVKIAQSYKGYGLAVADLIQEGTIGLMKAVKRFDPALGVRLVSFAVHWIKAEIHEFVLRNWRIVKIATTKAQRKLFFNIRKTKKRLGWFSQEEIKDVAQTLNVSEKSVLEMESRLNNYDMTFDLDDADDDSSVFSPSNYIAADKQYEPAYQIELEDFDDDNQSKLSKALLKLDARSRDIVQSRWLDEKKVTLETLAQKYHVSAERIRQIENLAIDSLKSGF